MLKAPSNEKLIETVLKQNASRNIANSISNDQLNRKANSSSNLNNSPSSMNNLTRELITSRLGKIDDAKLGPHLKIGSQFKFRIIIVEIAGISSDYSDIFCQFNFMHRNNEAFSTEPIQNSGKGPPLGFFHIQDVIRCFNVNFF